MADSFTNTARPGYKNPADGVSTQYYIPDKATRARVEGYVKAEKLLDVEEHMTLFQVQDPDTQKSYIPFDLAGMLARLMRHYTFSPGFRVRPIEQTEEAARNIDRIMENSDAITLFREVAESLPALGDAVIRIDLTDPETVGSDEEKMQAHMRYVKPHQVHVKRNVLDGQKVEEVTLAWMFAPSWLGLPEDDRYIVLQETHIPGSFWFTCSWWDGEHLVEGPPLQEVFPTLEPGVHKTGIDEIPMVFIPNNRKAGSFWGRSEFPRISPIIEALEKRMAQLDEVLDKHARPKLIVGPGTLDENGKLQLEDFDIIEVESSILDKAVMPEYLTWDMQIEAIKHQIEKLEEYFFILTETSPASFGLERDGSQVESARALRFKAHRTINKVEDLRDPFGDAIRKMLRIAQKLEVSADYDYEVSRVKLEWPDPIIEDDTQEALDYSLLRQNQLVSLHRAVKDLFGLTDAEAMIERARIMEDEVDLAEAANAGLTPPGFAGGGGALPEGEAAPEAGLDAVVEEVAAEGIEPGAEV